MKRCQIGVGGRRALDDAHDIMAECYGTLGALMINVREMRGQIAEQTRMIETYMSDIMRDRAEIQRLRAAITLVANRIDVLALDHDCGTTRRNIADDWAKEARAASGPNVMVSGATRNCD